MQKRKTYIILAISVVLVFVLCLLLLPNSGERTASSEKATTPQGGSPAGAAAGHAQDRDDGPAPDVSNDVGPGPKDDAVEYRLSLERGPYVRGQAIPCRVLIKNPTDALQMISRPLARGIDLLASGPHGKQYQAVWQDDATKEKEAEGLPLRPGCELAALLGPFMLMDNEGKASELPIGPYSISAAWKQQEGQAAEPPQIARKQEVDVVEFPFHVRLSAGRHPHTLEEPLIVRISLENHGSVPVCFLNRFYPFKHHFRIVLKREMDERGGQAAHGPDLVPLSVLPKISPDAGTGWITLQPGESLHVSFDAMGYLKDEGVYALQVAYQRRILIRDPKTGPRSTEQYRWESDTIRLNVAAKK